MYGSYGAQSNPFMGGYMQSLQRAYQSQRGAQPQQSQFQPQPTLGGSQWASQPSQSQSGNQYTAPGMSGKFGYDARNASSPSTTASGFYSPLPPGGIYGSQKWNNGSATDVFLKRGSPVYAPFDGMIQQGIRDVPPGPMGVPPGFYLQGQGLTMRGIHIQPITQGRVRAGQVIGYVSDDSMDMLGQYPGMPDGFQHADLAFSRSGQFSASGGDLDARQVLQQMGYQGTQIQGRTKGPPDAMSGMTGGMGMGMPGMPGFGGGGMSGMPGMPGMGMPGMGMQGGFGGGFGGGQGFGGGGFGMPGMPGMGMMGMQGMGGMPGMGMQGGGGGGNPFMMQMPQMMQMMGQRGGGPQMGGMGGYGGGGFGGFR